MSRFFVRSSVVVGTLIVLACLGLAVPFQLVYFLFAGWIHYLYRVVPQVRVDPSATATATVCLVLLTAGLHWFASWLYPLIAHSPMQKTKAPPSAGAHAGPPG